MPYPSDANMVILFGSWWDELSRAGMNSTITATPIPASGGTGSGMSGYTPNVTDAASWSWIKTRTWTTTPLASGLYALPLTANDDPDLTPFGGYVISAQGEPSFTVNITATASTITVTSDLAAAIAQCASQSGSTFTVSVGATVQAIHMTEAVVLSQPAPSPPAAYPTISQVNSIVASALASYQGGGGSSLVPTAKFTSGSHTPASGEFARYAPTSSVSVALPAAAAGQRFGFANVLASTSSFTTTFTCAGSDTFSDGTTSLALKPDERAVLIGASGGFTIESRTIVSSGTTYTQSATKTANYTAQANEIVVIDTSGGTFTVTGPTGGVPWGWRWKAGTVAPTIAAASGRTISGNASITPGLAPGTSQGELVLYQANGTDDSPIGGFKPQSALNLQHGAILNTHLLAWAYAQAWRWTSKTVDANEAPTTGSIVWPDGSTGTYTTDTAATNANVLGAVDAWHATYVPASGSTKTVTQPAVTRDTAGAVTAQPALTVA